MDEAIVKETICKEKAKRGTVKLLKVQKLFGDVSAVDRIDLVIKAGTYCCLLGPSGCGKTTTLRMIAGHETTSSGQILIDSIDIGNLPPAKRGTAMMFQNYALFPHLNVLDNVAFSLKMKGVAKNTRRTSAIEMLERVQMEEFVNRQPSQLSGGQQQRIALARALITKPEVLLLDEPLSALDPFLRVRMREELRSLQRDLGITFVHVTHSQEEAMALSDLVVVMNEGKIEQMGNAQEIYNKPRSPFVARFIGGHNVISGNLRLSSNGQAILDCGGGIEIKLPKTPSIHSSLSSISIRNDHISMFKIDEQRLIKGSSFKGLVSSVEYIGSYVRIGVKQEVCDDFSVTCSEISFFNSPVEVGDALIFSWNTNDIQILET